MSLGAPSPEEVHGKGTGKETFVKEMPPRSIPACLSPHPNSGVPYSLQTSFPSPSSIALPPHLAALASLVLEAGVFLKVKRNIEII